MFLSKTMALLLGIINQKPVNAYELTKMLLRMNIKHWYSIADSTVYATLKAAQKKGYLDGIVEKEGNMPEKTMYLITDAGRKKLVSTLESFICSFEYDITPFTIAVFFIDALDSAKAASILEERIDLLNKLVHGLQRQILQMEKDNVPAIFVANTAQNLYIAQAHLKGANEILSLIK